MSSWVVIACDAAVAGDTALRAVTRAAKHILAAASGASLLAATRRATTLHARRRPGDHEGCARWVCTHALPEEMARSLIPKPPSTPSSNTNAVPKPSSSKAWKPSSLNMAAKTQVSYASMYLESLKRRSDSLTRLGGSSSISPLNGAASHAHTSGAAGEVDISRSSCCTHTSSSSCASYRGSTSSGRTTSPALSSSRIPIWSSSGSFREDRPSCHTLPELRSRTATAEADLQPVCGTVVTGILAPSPRSASPWADGALNSSATSAAVHAALEQPVAPPEAQEAHKLGSGSGSNSSSIGIGPCIGADLGEEAAVKEQDGLSGGVAAAAAMLSAAVGSPMAASTEAEAAASPADVAGSAVTEEGGSVSEADAEMATATEATDAPAAPRRRCGGIMKRKLCKLLRGVFGGCTGRSVGAL